MNKICTVRVRVLPVELRALEAIAEIDQLKPSEALRSLLRQAAIERGVWPPTPAGDQTREVSYEHAHA